MFNPVLLGVDLASYSVATSMYECFGQKSFAFGRYRCGISYYSDIIKCIHNPRLLEKDIAKTLLLSFQKEHNTSCLVVPTTDWYVDLLFKVQSDLPPLFILALPDKTHFYNYSQKEKFYQALDACNIPHPETKVFLAGECYTHRAPDRTSPFGSSYKNVFCQEEPT